MIMTIKHSTSTAHIITNHNGKCKNLHGHNYNFIINIKRMQLDEMGMIADFSYIKDIVKEHLDNLYDHKCIIDYRHPQADTYEELGCRIVPYNPTAENMAKETIIYLSNILRNIFRDTSYNDIHITSITVEETAGNSITVSDIDVNHFEGV